MGGLVCSVYPIRNPLGEYMRNVKAVERIIDPSKVLTRKQKDALIERVINENENRLWVMSYLTAIEEFPTKYRLEMIRLGRFIPLGWLKDAVACANSKDILKHNREPLLYELAREYTILGRAKKRAYERIVGASL